MRTPSAKSQRLILLDIRRIDPEPWWLIRVIAPGGGIQAYRLDGPLEESEVRARVSRFIAQHNRGERHERAVEGRAA